MKTTPILIVMVAVLTLLFVAIVPKRAPPTIKQEVAITFFQAHATCEAQSDAWIQSCLMGSNTSTCWQRGYDIYTGCMSAHGWPINNVTSSNGVQNETLDSNSRDAVGRPLLGYSSAKGTGRSGHHIRTGAGDLSSATRRLDYVLPICIEQSRL